MHNGGIAHDWEAWKPSMTDNFNDCTFFECSLFRRSGDTASCSPCHRTCCFHEILHVFPSWNQSVVNLKLGLNDEARSSYYGTPKR